MRVNHLRAPSLDKQGARNLQRQITQKEYPNAEAEDFVGKTEVLSHTEFCKPYVGAVEVGDEVQKNRQRKDSPGNFAAERGSSVKAEGHGRPNSRIITVEIHESQSLRRRWPPKDVLSTAERRQGEIGTARTNYYYREAA